MTTGIRILLVAGLLFGCLAARAFAGDLNPPAGPVAPTHKTLTDVEPRTAINATNTPGDADSVYRITQAGSYYLTGNVTGVAAKRGIEIVASGVTLDLNGFELRGVAGSLDGVMVIAANLTNIVVVNGSVRDWGRKGVDLSLFSPFSCRVADLLARGNATGGIAFHCGGTVTNCSAIANTSDGISVGCGCTVSNCSAYLNDGHGIVSGGNGCTFSNCSAYGNGGVGIAVSGDCTVLSCSASFNASGILVGSSATIVNCSAYSNTDTGIGTDGIGCTFSKCSATANTGSGISSGGGSTVVDCTARSNAGDGIVCTSSCVIRSNACAANGSGGDGAGIHATGGDNRIEGNNCTLADRGIDVDSAGNVIVRNTCSGSASNWEIAAGNVCLVISATTAGAISGNSGGTGPGSTDPNANFTY